MGLIAYFKKKFSKDIKTEQDISGYLVFPFKAKNNKIYLNCKAVVPQDTVLVFGSNGKTFDCLQAGETMLGAVTLPKCSKKFKLYKLNKDGSVPKDFKANAYFVSLSEHKNFEFSTYKKLKYKNEKDGKFWVDINFEIDFKVANPEKLLQFLLTQYAYLKPNESESILGDWLSDFVTTQMLKTDYMRSNFQENKAELLQVLFLKVQKNLSNIGAELIDLRFKEIKMSKSKESKKTKEVLQKLAENQAKNTWQGLETFESQVAEEKTNIQNESIENKLNNENQPENKSPKKFVELE
ncbi:MAG: SPFH domain-containing protein [Clostridia bacterium]|nr:SPFH domain-containing protein [Clostridia bacterium]